MLRYGETSDSLLSDRRKYSLSFYRFRENETIERIIEMKKYQRKNSTYYIGALFFILISTIFAVVLQFFKGDVLDYAIAGDAGTTLKYAVLLIGFILGEVLLYYCYKRLSARFSVGCTRLLKHDIFESIIQQDYVTYKEKQQGEYVAKYTNEADMIKSRYFQMLPLFWEILLKIIFVSLALFILDWRIALITILLLTTPLYVPKLIEKRLQKAQTEYLKAVEENLAKVNDWLSGFEIIKNFSIERQILLSFDESNTLSMDKLFRDTILGAAAQLITTLISYLSYFIVLACSTWLVLSGEFSAGDFFVAIGMIDQLSYPLISLAEIIRQLIAIKPSCTAMEQFVSQSKKDTDAKSLACIEKEICYDGVSFGYTDDRSLLQGFSFTAEKGKKYLIKGSSGCGKTTAINLLLRYYDVTSGKITIDGVPISEYDTTYAAITVVRQEAILFHDTLRNNLTMYGDASDDKLMETLKNLGLDRFANLQSLDTIITENGANLSGGEKKRICLARALLRDTSVLILDEPLANLDESTAKKIEDLLLSISGKLLLVVSHQFTEDKLCLFDDVIVLGTQLK